MAAIASGHKISSLISRIRTPKSNSQPSNSSIPTSTSSPLLSLKPSRRAITDFYVKLDHPHRKYKPGEQVTGSIVLSTTRATRITHLTLTLNGSVVVYPHDRRGNKWGEDVVKDITYKDKKMIRGSRSRGTTIEGSNGGRGVVLFEEEQVIVGEGRLGAGGLEVGFVVDFPTKGGLSSLDFERGAVTYLLTATLTRPTTLNPVTTCHTEVGFVEHIDVALFTPPKPLTISIEPQRPLRRLKSSSSSNDSTTFISNQNQPAAISPPHSPSILKPSSSSIPSSPPSPTTSSNQAYPMATIELLRPACLPGETIPIKITISHVKQMKSLSGVITTLSRQCRLDTLPPADKVLTASSLSFSKSNISTFRKDLSQSVAALIVDPRTLTTVIRTSVKVPGDAFPSVANVPNGLLGFTYFVEVVVDLGGKLAVRNAMGDVMMNGSGGGDVRRVSPEGIIETDRIRREKGVISCTFEIVVGTVDNGKRKKKKSISYHHGDESSVATSENTSNTSNASDTISREREAERDQTVEEVRRYMDDAPDYHNGNGHSSSLNITPPPPHHLPMIPPTISPQGSLDEKSRIRLAEQQLLPSAPPRRHSDSDEHTPSAPPLIDPYEQTEENHHLYGAPIYEAGSSASAEAVEHDKIELERQRLMAQASQPPLRPSSPDLDASAPDITAEDEEDHGGLPRYVR